MKNNEQYKKIVSFFSSLILLAALAADFMYIWYEYYSDAIVLPFLQTRKLGGNSYLCNPYHDFFQGLRRSYNGISEADGYALFTGDFHGSGQYNHLFSDKRYRT